MLERDHLIIEQIPRLRRYARALTGDAAQADDLVQDCVERAWNKFHLWRRGSNMRAWLFTIMHNLHVNSRRRVGGRPAVISLQDWTDDRGVAPAQEKAAEFTGVRWAITQLPEEQRQVVLLVGLEELSYQEVAKILGIPIGTVMSRLSRGRDRLRHLMMEGKGASERSRK
jgi:RNA polymerase sigma-70 factor (ECF subfamily)